jgi:hypothetical protein
MYYIMMGLKILKMSLKIDPFLMKRKNEICIVVDDRQKQEHSAR